MRRTEGRDNFGVTPHGECDVVVVGDSLDLEAKSDTDENEFWNYFASMTLRLRFALAFDNLQQYPG